MPNPNKIRLIALDLDGTLLNSAKELTPRTRDALYAAAAQGIEIVPSTGRFYGGMPESVRALPFVRYAITINGSQVFDVRTGGALYRAELPLEECLQILSYLDSLPVIYDCYMDNWGWMTAAMQAKADEFAPDEHYRRMLRELRSPVPELKAYLREQGKSVQKLQLFTRDLPLRERLLKELDAMFPALAVSTSVGNNLEINHRDANKGAALLHLAGVLGLERSALMAFGDGMNDLLMLSAAGTGVAMENAGEEVKAAADRVTASCDHEGVAQVIEELLS